MNIPLISKHDLWGVQFYSVFIHNSDQTLFFPYDVTLHEDLEEIILKTQTKIYIGSSENQTEEFIYYIHFV